MAKIPVALQMYTLREIAKDDFVGTLKKVADIGYHGVELAGTGGLSAAELARVLDDYGLGRAGAHIGVDSLSGDGLAKTLDYYEALGTKFLTIPGLPKEMMESAAAWKRTAGILTEGGRKLKAHGIQLSYHNHAHEFQLYDGQAGLDILYDNSDADALHAEIDTYWVQYGKVDPADYMAKRKNRLSLVHIKDMANDEKRSFAEIGEGILDWKRIFAVCDAAGTKWLIVEQDSCARPCLESVKISFENLKKMGRA